MTAGVPYAEAVTQTLLRPLEMSRSTFNPGVAMTYRHAQGHDTRGDAPMVVRPFNSSPSIAPAGDLITTVGDLSRLARALLSDGILDGKRVLPQGLLARLGTVQGRGGPFLAGQRDYGFGPRRAIGRYVSASETVEIVTANETLGIRQGTRVFPIRARSEGHWEIVGYPAYLPSSGHPFGIGRRRIWPAARIGAHRLAAISATGVGARCATCLTS